jgi:hypothetical protein
MATVGRGRIAVHNACVCKSRRECSALVGYAEVHMVFILAVIVFVVVLEWLDARLPWPDPHAHLG